MWITTHGTLPYLHLIWQKDKWNETAFREAVCDPIYNNRKFRISSSIYRIYSWKSKNLEHKDLIQYFWFNKVSFLRWYKFMWRLPTVIKIFISLKISFHLHKFSKRLVLEKPVQGHIPEHLLSSSSLRVLQLKLNIPWRNFQKFI